LAAAAWLEAMATKQNTSTTQKNYLK